MMKPKMLRKRPSIWDVIMAVRFDGQDLPTIFNVTQDENGDWWSGSHRIHIGEWIAVPFYGTQDAIMTSHTFFQDYYDPNDKDGYRRPVVWEEE